MKEFRKKEGVSQMKLAGYLNTSPTYIGEIEVGKKFPSMDMIEKIANILRVKPYLFFIDQTEQNIENIYPKLPKSMQNEIRSELNISMNELFKEILSKY